MAKRISAVFFLIVIFSVFAFLGVRLLGSRGDGLTVSLRSLVDGEFSTQLRLLQQRISPPNPCSNRWRYRCGLPAEPLKSMVSSLGIRCL